MSNSLRKEVLRCFKSIHQARKRVFEGDERALSLSRHKINEEFKANKHLTDEKDISKLIEHSKAVEHELRTTVIQAREVEPGKFEVRIRPETTKVHNVPYRDEWCSQPV